MGLKIPEIINDYVRASNAHNVKSILECFSETATVQDEGKTLRGTDQIQGWIVKTIEKYNFHFKPLRFNESDAGIEVAIEVSGIFAGSPVTLDYHFGIQNWEISSLEIK